MTSRFSKHKYFLPTVIIFIISVLTVFTTYIFQTIEDELDNEILVVEHQKLLLNAIKQYQPEAAQGNKSATTNLQWNSRLFESSIEALRIGGTPEGMKEKFVIPGTKIIKANQQLEAMVKTWREYETHHSSARFHYRNNVIPGAEQDMERVENEFYNLEIYNLKLLEVFIQNKIDVHSHKILAIGGMLALMIIVLFLAYSRYIKHVNKPLENLLKVTKGIEHGDLSAKLAYTEDSSIGQISRSINRIINNQNDLTDKFNKLGDGEFSFKIKRHGENDKLNTTLENMRKKLFEFYELDRKKATQGNWVNKGVALFSDILRNNTDDISKLTDILINEIVKYLKANQGCLYLLEDKNNDTHNKLILKSTYAWERKKFQEKEIEVGEGLIGQAFIERGTIYLTDVPDNYINITSGLGEANPRSILIVPMIHNNEIYGVLEIASFKEYEEFELELVEKIAESIASAISTVRTNQHTRLLLQESQILTEQMKLQEEKLRQNAEELQETQANINRQLEIIDFEKQKNTAVLETSVDAILTFDQNGFVEFFNEAAEDIFTTKREHIIGKKIDSIIPFELTKYGDDYSVKLRVGDQLKEIMVRSEVNIYDSKGEEVNVLMTLSVNNIQNKHFFAVFIQSISVEIF